jgi:PTH1 family peptidyl-tRNA hydrolase
MVFFKIDPAETLIVHDETELSFGTTGFRCGGGLGGHKGLRSVRKNLGTPDFWRFRIGIGRPARGDLSSHVLGRFSAEEEALLDAYLEKAASGLMDCVSGLSQGARIV